MMYVICTLMRNSLTKLSLLSVQFWIHFILLCLLTQWIQECAVYCMYLLPSVAIAATIFIVSHTVICVHINSMSNIGIFQFWFLELNLFIWLWPWVGLYSAITVGFIWVIMINKHWWSSAIIKHIIRPNAHIIHTWRSNPVYFSLHLVLWVCPPLPPQQTHSC